MPQDYGIFNVFIKLDALKEIQIKNEDIFRVYFNEDIYFFGSVGKLILYDKYGLKEYGPITGDEKLVVVYGKTGGITKEFSLQRITRISGVSQFKQTDLTVLELHFVDSFFPGLVSKRFSRAWPGQKKGSEIVKDILEKMVGIDMKFVDIEDSATTFENFYMPYWSPGEAIRWISNRAIGTKGKCNYGYLMYPSSAAYLSFVTLDNLLNNAKIDNEIYLFETTDLNYTNKILSWQITGVDQMGIRELGGGRLLGYDSSEKKILGLEKNDEFIYSDAVKKISALGQSSLFDGSTIDNKSDIFNYAYENTGESDPTILKNLFYNNFIRRYSLQNMVKLLVPGHNKRFAGQKINVNWPSVSTKEIFSSMDSGQYLIKSIVHSFGPMQTPAYLQTLTCIKNAYQSNKFNTTTGILNNILGSFKLGIFK
jgi:hypothetical protein